MAEQKIWLTVEHDAVVQYIEQLRNCCEALELEDNAQLRELGGLINATFKYLVMFDQRSPNQLANPVHFASVLLPTMRFNELLGYLERQDVAGALTMLGKLKQIADRHRPAEENDGRGEQC